MTVQVTNMNIHGAKVIEAKAFSQTRTHWLTIYGREIASDWLGNKFEITFFFDHPGLAEQYATAINSCNDREAADACEDTCSNG